ncbi:hypothetical protein AB4876_05615 [Zhongshania guokunii]|uniref:DUF3149 domain-containing protein n=1 Tax=Zhongshania guokunii TaxID=641783 RepID=A0ABV3U5V2_9GAMM
MQKLESLDWSVLLSLVDSMSPVGAVFIMALVTASVALYSLHVVLKVIIEVKK